jgi:hypothetical protein
VGQFGVTLQKRTVDVEITADGKARYRVLPRNEFDEKGNIKPFKPDRTDPNWRLGGIKGEFKDIEKDLWVTVRLRRSGTRSKPGNVYLTDVIVVLGREDAPTPGSTRPRGKSP